MMTTRAIREKVLGVLTDETKSNEAVESRRVLRSKPFVAGDDKIWGRHAGVRLGADFSFQSSGLGTL
jgi:hypothetical protein